MARIFKRRRNPNALDEEFYEALPYQQRMVYDDTADVEPVSAASMLSRIVYAVFAAIEAVLLLRFLFQLIGAGSSAFVDFIYNLSQPLVRPFVGTFDTAIPGVSTFSWATVVAIAVYALVAWLLITLINLFRTREVY